MNTDSTTLAASHIAAVMAAQAGAQLDAQRITAIAETSVAIVRAIETAARKSQAPVRFPSA